MGSRVRFRPGVEPVPTWIRATLGRHLRSVEARIGTTLRRDGVEVAAPLGCGAHGCVFELEDGRVLKVTSDESEGSLTLYVQRLQRRRVRTAEGPVLCSTARFDDVFAFPRRVRVDGSLVRVVGIVRERVGPAGIGVSLEVDEAADLYTEGWDTYCTAEVEGTGARYVGVAVARVGLRRLRGADAAGRALAALLEYAWADGLPLMDVHSGNLAKRQARGPGGARKGQVVVYDLGSTESCVWPREGELPTGGQQVSLSVVDRLAALAAAIPVLGSR